MFSKFNLKNINNHSEIFKDQNYLQIGKTSFETYDKNIKRSFRDFINSEGTIDGSSLQNAWFPSQQRKFDVFLSHSHADEELALKFTGWLKEKFGLDTFIDSCLWGYSNDLLKEIDDAHCKNLSNDYYVYEKRNSSTSHVHMMLSIALANMIDNTECIMFLNTPNSITWSEELQNATFSPWIYHELAMSSMIKQAVRRREGLFESAETKIAYDVSKYLNKLIELEISDLNEWDTEYKGSMKGIQAPLDVLYKLQKPQFDWK